MVPTHRKRYLYDEWESEGEASERIFHAGKNSRVLTRVPRVVDRASPDGAPEQVGSLPFPWLRIGTIILFNKERTP